MNVFELAQALRNMTDQQLVQLAQQHQNDAAIMAAVMNEKTSRDKLRASASAAPAPQGQQPTVREQMLAGLGNIPTEGMTSMADGGIVSFDDGGSVSPWAAVRDVARGMGEKLLDTAFGVRTAEAAQKDRIEQAGKSPLSQEELWAISRLPENARNAVSMALKRKKSGKQIAGDDKLIQLYETVKTRPPVEMATSLTDLAKPAQGSKVFSDRRFTEEQSAPRTGITAEEAAYRQFLLARGKLSGGIDAKLTPEMVAAARAHGVKLTPDEERTFERQQKSLSDQARAVWNQFNPGNAITGVAGLMGSLFGTPSPLGGLGLAGAPATALIAAGKAANTDGTALDAVTAAANDIATPAQQTFVPPSATPAAAANPANPAAPAPASTSEKAAADAANKQLRQDAADRAARATREAADKSSAGKEKAVKPASLDLEKFFEEKYGVLRNQLQAEQTARETALTTRQAGMRKQLPDEATYGQDLYADRVAKLEAEGRDDAHSKNLAWADALIAMGAAMMSSKSPTFFGAVGEGVKAGSEEYARVVDRLASRETRRQDLQMKIEEARSQIKFATAKERRDFDRQSAVELQQLRLENAKDLAAFNRLPIAANLELMANMDKDRRKHEYEMIQIKARGEAEAYARQAGAGSRSKPGDLTEQQTAQIATLDKEIKQLESEINGLRESLGANTPDTKAAIADKTRQLRQRSDKRREIVGLEATGYDIESKKPAK